MSARADRVKVTMELPRALWKHVKHQAIEENRKPWQIVTEALGGYLNGNTDTGGGYDLEGNYEKLKRRVKAKPSGKEGK